MKSAKWVAGLRDSGIWAIWLFRCALAFIPRHIKLRLIASIGGALASAVVSGRRPTKGVAAVAGLFRSVVGIGVGARLCSAALRQLQVATVDLDLTPMLHPYERAGYKPTQSGTVGDSGVVIVHVNPPELPIALMAIGRKAVRRRHIVGYWAWELPDIPKSWLPGLRLVDEIWVPSCFVADALNRWTTLPIRVVPHLVSSPTPASCGRVDFGIPEHSFVVLCAFDMRSGYVRKNPLAAIRAFLQAFGDRSDAALVLKISEPELARNAFQDIHRAIEGLPNVYVISTKLSANDMAALIACSDVVISLHRSEGFGLVLAEAMLLGKPVVATRWSGNMDFMSDDNSALIDFELVSVVDDQGIYTMKGQQWAEPDVAQAANWLRKLKEDTVIRQSIGMASARDAAAFFSIERYREALKRTSLFDWVFTQVL